MAEDDDFEGTGDDSGDEGPAGLTRAEVLRHALRIAKDYKDQDLTLTLRQLYYRFVATGLTGSGQKVYKRIGSVLTAARYSGEFPIDWIEDRGREVGHGDFTRTCNGIQDAFLDAQGITKVLPEFLLKRARWAGQPVHVSVWVEKQALEGVFEGICRQLGVGLFACKGYPSVSALYDWLRHAYFNVSGEHSDDDHRVTHFRRYSYGNGFDWTERHEGSAERCVILYFGDHDPDGWEIPRSAERGLQTLMDTYGLAVPLTFERIALNMDQIEKYAPPPFEAKMTSARFRGYVEEHDTHDAWELDALEPSVLRDMIKGAVENLFNDDIRHRNRLAVQSYRADLRERLNVPKNDEVDDDDQDDEGGEE